LYGGQLDSLDKLLRDVASNGYTHTAFEIQRGLGLGWDITALNQRKLETLLSRPWTADGKTFRDRCWENKANLVSGVQSSLTQGLLRGDGLQKITGNIKDQFGVSRYKAGRLAHTETAYFNGVANQEIYKDLGVEKVEILETLDRHTCSICGGLDGKVIPLSQYEPGVTVPPFHPNCRGTTCPYFDDMEGERAARNEEGEVYYVPADMNYTTWKKTFVDGGAKGDLTLAGGGDILAQRQSKVEGSGVQYVGKLDKDIYRCVTDDITTDEVIITNVQIQHVMERHPGDYERFFGFFREIISNPDYIIEANKPNTAVVLKEIQAADESFKLVLRLAVSTDSPNYKNSIITFMKIDKKDLERLVRNKKVLYKRE